MSPLKHSSFTALPVFSFHSHSPHFRKTTEHSPVPGKRRSPLEGSTSAPCPSQHVCLPLPPTPLPWWALPVLPPGKSFGTERVPGSLTAQKPLDRPGWWKGESAVIQMPATGGGGQMSIQGPSPLPQATSGARAFRNRSGRARGGGRELHAETAQSALTAIVQLVIGGLSSGILVVLSTVNLSAQGPSASIAFATSSRNSGGSCTCIAWSSCGQLLPPGFAASVKRFTAYGSEEYLWPLKKN